MGYPGLQWVDGLEIPTRPAFFLAGWRASPAGLARFDIPSANAREMTYKYVVIVRSRFGLCANAREVTSKDLETLSLWLSISSL